jgi:L-iditol 2-dehydrogenase
MKAMFFPEPHRAEIVERSVPIPGRGEVLVRVRAAGICASDVAAFQGKHNVRRPPVITGHELAGEIAEVGPGATGWAVGERVAVEPHLGCGACAYCRRGQYHECPEKRFVGVGDWIGAFAEYVVAAGGMCHRMPANMPYDEGAALEPFCVGLHAVRRAQPQMGEQIAILGGGTIGLMTLLAAGLTGPNQILLSEPSAVKRSLASRCGAGVTIDPRSQDVVEEIRRATDGLGADLVFVAVSAPEVLRQGLEACRRIGKLVIVASFFDETAVNARQIQVRERTILGTSMYTAEDYRLAISLWGAGRVDLRPLISDRIGLAEAPAAVAELARNRRPDAVKIVIEFP